MHRSPVRLVGRSAYTLWLLALSSPAAWAQTTVEVPLVQMVTPAHPTGFALDWALGIAIGDYDGDGYVDLYNNLTGQLWHNDSGQDWSPGPNLFPGGLTPRYGAAFGDFNRDGRMDLATEPRTSQCFQLFRNDGGGVFTDIAAKPAQFPTPPCNDQSETACWGDVDADGWPDLFLPTYPTWRGGQQDNYFWHNQGPIGAGGDHVFTEISRPAGLASGPANNRPEGAQMCDYDGDGDLDLYSNGSAYRNISTVGSPLFERMAELGSGIGQSGTLDEGAAFCDYDLDGDYDLICCYVGFGNVIWENRGDGTFFQAETSMMASWQLGSDYGLSIADWDMDGDLDISTRFVFRKNLLAETGQRGFSVATYSILQEHLVQPQIAWADFDLDGDLDAAVGNFWVAAHGVGAVYENTTYDQSTPMIARRHVRVSPRGDGVTVPGGLRTEFGASATIRVFGEQGIVRRQFTASGHGYLNQNEYDLTFALPSTGGATFFDLEVEFVDDPSLGLWRVDANVNPLLRGVFLEGLQNREIAVLRNGTVVMDGVTVLPSPLESPRMTQMPNRLLEPTTGVGLPIPLEGLPDAMVGAEMFNISDTHYRLTELVLDGHLRPGTPANVWVWDMQTPTTPRLVASWNVTTSSRNHRAVLPADVILRPRSRYRAVAAVQTFRITPISGPIRTPDVIVRGGLFYEDADPATGLGAAFAGVTFDSTAMAVRLRPAMVGVGMSLGSGFSSAGGAGGNLSSAAQFEVGKRVDLEVDGLPPGAPLAFVVGQGVQVVRALDAALVLPAGLSVIPGTWAADTAGKFSLPLVWPELPSGTETAFQVWYSTPEGPASTNVMFVETP
ncbi:MAG: VCBS repeat-containing protein [Planctomycetota bacterium]